MLPLLIKSFVAAVLDVLSSQLLRICGCRYPRNWFWGSTSNRFFWIRRYIELHNLLFAKNHTKYGWKLLNHYFVFLSSTGTALVFYCNREYASHSAHMVYETPDGRRLGFQMHNLMGFPGKKIEANIGNVRLANTVSYNLGSDSFVPLRIEGEILTDDGFYGAISFSSQSLCRSHITYLCTSSCC